MTNKDTIIGVFADRALADHAVSELNKLGYAHDQMSIIVRDDNTGKDVVEPANAGERTASGAVTGATTGGALGALAGLLVGLGAVTIPGIGLFFIGGPLAAALGLTGAAAATVSGAASGAVAGGLVGGLVGLGLPEETARAYESRLKEGAVLLAVPVLENIDNTQVRQIFAEQGADQVKTITH